MIDLNQKTYRRLLALAQHPRADMKFEAMIDMCVEEGIEFDHYAAALTMQYAIIEAMHAFSTERRAAGANQSTVMNSVAGASAVGVASLTFDEPLPGYDIAQMMANDVVVTFANFLAPRLAVSKPPDLPKAPTNDAPTSRH